MMTKEEYEKEVVRMWDSLREHKGRRNCVGVSCSDCIFYNREINSCYNPDIQTDPFEAIVSAQMCIKKLEKWSKEHPPKKYKVSQTEYDILRSLSECRSNLAQFGDFRFLLNMIEKGYFYGANSDTNIDTYIDLCEVTDE